MLLLFAHPEVPVRASLSALHAGRSIAQRAMSSTLFVREYATGSSYDQVHVAGVAVRIPSYLHVYHLNSRTDFGSSRSFVCVYHTTYSSGM